MGKMAVAIDLTDSERRELGSLASRRRTAQGLAQRARIVLLAAEGLENKDVRERVGAAPTAGKRRRLRSVVWRACWTSPVRVRRVVSAKTRLQR